MFLRSLLVTGILSLLENCCSALTTGFFILRLYIAIDLNLPWIPNACQNAAHKQGDQIYGIMRLIFSHKPPFQMHTVVT